VAPETGDTAAGESRDESGRIIDPDSGFDFVTLTLPDAPVESAVREAEPSLALIRESGAKVVAYVLVGTFSGVILVTLLISLAIIAKTGSSEHAKLFTDTLVPLFESLGKFVSPVFGPLLAFVLGYYFSKEQSRKSGGE
jgi:hypothetical protein